jgi:hypothetical protein
MFFLHVSCGNGQIRLCFAGNMGIEQDEHPPATGGMVEASEEIGGVVVEIQPVGQTPPDIIRPMDADPVHPEKPDSQPQ